MPRGEGYVHVDIDLPRWLHEKLKRAAADIGVSQRQLAAVMVREGCRDLEGLPKPPRGRELPELEDVIRAYAVGDRVTGPCGEPWPCGYDEDDIQRIGDWEFCGNCGTRTV